VGGVVTDRDQTRTLVHPAGGPQPLANKINWLFENLWPRDLDPPQTYVAAAAAIHAATGEDISSTTVWKLRTGRADNPQFKTLKALAAFFNVPIGYFGDDEESETLADQLALLTLLRDSGVDRASLRALVHLPDEGRQMVAEFLASAARMEQRRQAKHRHTKTDATYGTPGS
jgi:transcriptional regulator with XRE-family HTH domain